MSCSPVGGNVPKPAVQAQAAAAAKPGTAPTLKARIEERSESAETKAIEAAHGEKVNKLA